jgi:radical SAM superfamily enzyme YgiQ (UPF0313 family)
MADIHEMVDYINALNKMSKRKNAVRISINPFIPKSHTPFQWIKFDYNDLKSKFDYINKNLKNVNLKIEDLKDAYIQYILSVGGAEIGNLIEKTFQMKHKFRKWKEMDIQWSLGDELPWKNIDTGIKREFLKEEYKKAINGEITPWCETFGCYKCGSCE